jgi:hypothetical protein
MARRPERSDSTVTQFPGKIQLDKQWDVTLPATTSPKRTEHDDLQTAKLPKRIRHEKQSSPSIAGDDTDEVIFEMLPPRLPPKLKASETLFVP